MKHSYRNDDSSEEENQDEDVACRTISDLDVMATDNILITSQQLFEQHEFPAAAAINGSLDVKNTTKK